MKIHFHPPERFFLGHEYSIGLWWNIPERCRLIKVTEKGYNFLNLRTHKCIFKRHFYPSKDPRHQDGIYFFLIKQIKISEHFGPADVVTHVS